MLGGGASEQMSGYPAFTKYNIVILVEPFYRVLTSSASNIKC